MDPRHDRAYPEVLQPRPPAHLVQKARHAASVCPTKAILIAIAEHPLRHVSAGPVP
jgi:hypothetical protein